MDNFKNHLRTLIQLAISDQAFDKQEKMWIYMIGKANRIPEVEIDELIAEQLGVKEDINISFSALSFDEKFEYLYNIIQLMKIDSEVFLTEIKYCESLAEKLGFDKKVVQKMSSRIYSDPSITADRESLKKMVRKLEI